MATRILAVLAAAFLITAFALATLQPVDLPLGQELFLLDRGLLNTFQAGVQRHLSPWLWDSVIVPLLVRPVWLIPAMLGILCCGLALTFSGRRSAHGSRRRS